MYRIILWGVGAVYNTHLNLLKLYEREKEICIIGVIANNLNSVKEVDGYEVYKPQKILEIDYDYLMIMNKNNFFEILEMAVTLGISKEKIISYKVLEIPNLNFKTYFEIKSKKISIISNNCWGGIVYEKLGLECLSPFKNLFIEDKDYIKLLLNLDKYMKMPFKFDHYEIDIHSKEKYPVMKLGDVFIHCNHDKDVEAAIENWNRRVKKINYDNLFVEMYTEDKCIMEQFCKLNSYQNKICFVPFETDFPYCMYLMIEEPQKEFWEIVNSNPVRGITYNLLDLLSMNQIYRVIKNI